MVHNDFDDHGALWHADVRGEQMFSWSDASLYVKIIWGSVEGRRIIGRSSPRLCDYKGEGMAVSSCIISPFEHINCVAFYRERVPKE